MKMNHSDIKQEIIDNWQHLMANAYTQIDDRLAEMADSAVPVYYSDIISDWQEMDNEFVDSWQELGQPESLNITNLMTIDLCNYYRHQYDTIYYEVLEEKEGISA